MALQDVSRRTRFGSRRRIPEPNLKNLDRRLRKTDATSLVEMIVSRIAFCDASNQRPIVAKRAAARMLSGSVGWTNS
jgi:hypothetical protein